MYIYYDSKTGNVRRFSEKVKKERPEWVLVKVEEDTVVENEGHFITYTTSIGKIPQKTISFFKNENNRKYIKSVSSSGNMNWGKFFAIAADKISRDYKIPVGIKFELSGTNIDVEKFIQCVEENING